MMRKIVYIWAVCLIAAAALAGLPDRCQAGGGVLKEEVSVDITDLVGQLEAAVKASPSDAGLRMALGEAWFMVGEADTSTMSPDPAKPRPMNEGFTRAEESFRAALKADSGAYLAHYYLALIRMQTGRMKEASDELYLALGLKDDDYRIYQKLHSAYTTLGAHKQASLVMSRALLKFPNTFDAYKRLAISNMIMGNHNVALDYSARALKIAQDDGLRAIRADAFLALNKPDMALKECEVMLRADAANPTAHATAAKAYLALNQKDKARQSAERALALDPTNTLAREVLTSLGAAPARGR